MGNPRIDQLDPHTALDGDDLLHLYQDDGVDRKASLTDHFAWLKAQPTFAPSLDLGTFYVDAKAGSDAADGRSLATARKTVQSILHAGLSPGLKIRILLKDGQTHMLGANINLVNAYVEINNVNPDAVATTILTSEFTSDVHVNSIYLNNTSLFLNNITLRTVDGTDRSASQYSAMIFAISGGSGLLNFDPAAIELVDTPLIFMSANGAGLRMGLANVDISVTPGGGATNYRYFIAGNGCFTLNGQGVTLAEGLTWKGIIKDLYYGADHSPNNFTHNLGTAFDV